MFQVPDAVLVHWMCDGCALLPNALMQSFRMCQLTKQHLYADLVQVTRLLAECEDSSSSLDANLDTVSELLMLALQPKKEGLGGVDRYLISKLAQNQPSDIKSAMARLSLGMQNSILVCASVQWACRTPS
jgi:hypothetical protein